MYSSEVFFQISISSADYYMGYNESFYDITLQTLSYKNNEAEEFSVTYKSIVTSSPSTVWFVDEIPVLSKYFVIISFFYNTYTACLNNDIIFSRNRYATLDTRNRSNCRCILIEQFFRHFEI